MTASAPSDPPRTAHAVRPTEATADIDAIVAAVFATIDERLERLPAEIVIAALLVLSHTFSQIACGCAARAAEERAQKGTAHR